VVSFADGRSGRQRGAARVTGSEPQRLKPVCVGGLYAALEGPLFHGCAPFVILPTSEVEAFPWYGFALLLFVGLWRDAGGGARATYFESQRQSQNLDGRECPSHTGSVPYGHFPQTVDRKRRRSGMSEAPEVWVGVRCYCTTRLNVCWIFVEPDVATTVIV